MVFLISFLIVFIHGFRNPAADESIHVEPIYISRISSAAGGSNGTTRSLHFAFDGHHDPQELCSALECARVTSTAGWAPDYAMTGSNATGWHGGVFQFNSSAIFPADYLIVNVSVELTGRFDCEAPKAGTGGGDGGDDGYVTNFIYIYLHGQQVGLALNRGVARCPNRCLNCGESVTFTSWSGDAWAPFTLGAREALAVRFASSSRGEGAAYLSNVTLTLFGAPPLRPNVFPVHDLAPPQLSTRDLIISSLGMGLSCVTMGLLLACCLTSRFSWRGLLLLLARVSGYQLLETPDGKLRVTVNRELDEERREDSSDDEADPILLWSKMSEETKMSAISELKLINVIGRGSYGEVWRAEWMNTVVAVKKLPAHITGRLDENMDREVYEFLVDFKRECAIMKQQCHPNVLQILATYLDPPDLCMVMEYMSRGSLFEILHSEEELNWYMLWGILMDAARGMAYLHSSIPRVIHRDLKSHNLLVDQNWRCKVADFGLAKMMGSPTMRTMTACGTPCWTAPEVLRNETYTEKCDVYSFGIVLWECVTRREPFEDMPPFQVIFAVGSEGLTPEIPEECPEDLKKLMRSCWNEEMNLRPSFFEIINLLDNAQELDFDVVAPSSEEEPSEEIEYSEADRFLVEQIVQSQSDQSEQRN